MKHVSVIKRPQSPRYSIAYFCPKKLKRVFKTTSFLVSDPQGYRKALDEATARGREALAAKHAGDSELWSSWAETYIRDRYKGREKTLRRYVYAWSQWSAFLHSEGIHTPRALDYKAVLRFFGWRSAQVKRSSGKGVSRNTALCDIKVMSLVMREAMRRGFANTNPAERLGIQKDPAKQKPEILAHEIVTIRKELATRPEWMRICFEIAIHQGCRLSETSVPMERIDLERQTIQFHAKGKGRGEKNVFVTQLHPALLPLVKELKDRGARVTCTLPQMAAKEWHTFFKEIGLPHLCFHCTRVTVITQMARNGVPISQAMAYVGHASETIHRIYQRLAAADLSRAVAAIGYAGGATPKTRGDDQANLSQRAA